MVLAISSKLAQIFALSIYLGDSLGGTKDRIKWDIFPFWAPGANFEVLPRAKKSKLGQTKKYTPRTIPNDARNIIELV